MNIWLDHRVLGRRCPARHGAQKSEDLARRRSAISWVRFQPPWALGRRLWLERRERPAFMHRRSRDACARPRVHTALSPRSRVGHERSLVAEELLLDAGIRC